MVEGDIEPVSYLVSDGEETLIGVTLQFEHWLLLVGGHCQDHPVTMETRPMRWYTPGKVMGLLQDKIGNVRKLQFQKMTIGTCTYFNSRDVALCK